MPPIKLTLFNTPKQKSNYMLTQKGKVKAEELNMSGPKGEVVGALDSSEGPCTVSEIVNVTKLSPSQVKQTVQVLMRDGWVRKVNTE